MDYLKGLPVTALTKIFISFSFRKLEGIEQADPFSANSFSSLKQNYFIA